jgi:hypothetical protein
MPFRGFTQRFRKKKIRTFRIPWPVGYARCLLTTREGDFMDIPLQKETLKKSNVISLHPLVPAVIPLHCRFFFFTNQFRP